MKYEEALEKIKKVIESITDIKQYKACMNMISQFCTNFVLIAKNTVEEMKAKYEDVKALYNLLTIKLRTL